MKVAIGMTARWHRASIDFDGYAAALCRAGHEPLLVCLGNDAGDADFPVIVANPDSLQSSAFWKKLGCDLAIIYSGMREPAVIRAIQESGTFVILRADNDGLASVRVFPKAVWTATVDPSIHLIDFARRLKHWKARYLRHYETEDRELLTTIDSANLVAIESQEAANNLRRIFAYWKRDELTDKIRVVPHSVTDLFLSGSVGNSDRAARIFCGGRWNDAQKDPETLAATLQYLLKHQSFEVLIAGSGAQEAFRSLARQHSHVELLGVTSRENLKDQLVSCQFLLSSSRWESQPIGSLEALCMGATLVGPPIPGFVDLVSEGKFGTLAASRRARHLAQAAIAENANWKKGLRNPVEISDVWRSRVSNDAVIAGFLRATTS